MNFGLPSLSSLFQSTLPMKGATMNRVVKPDDFIVSIHAPNEGSDHTLVRPTLRSGEFQSTLPMKGATTLRSGPAYFQSSFNPRSQ